MSIIDRFRLTGKKAIVTGAAQGIGHHVAIALAEAGADVALFDLNEASETEKQIRALGREAFCIKMNVADEAAVEAAFAEVDARFDGVDILFNNAGICICTEAETMTLEQWRKVVDVDLTAQFLMARAAGQRMIKAGKGGSIISTASMSGHIVNVPQPQCAYNAAKAGLIHLTKSLATEWARYNIRVNCISPGYMATPLSIDVPRERMENWFFFAPMKRMGLPEELQGAVVYLASEAASYTTGADIIIDGGYSCV